MSFAVSLFLCALQLREGDIKNVWVNAASMRLLCVVVMLITGTVIVMVSDRASRSRPSLPPQVDRGLVDSDMDAAPDDPAALQQRERHAETTPSERCDAAPSLSRLMRNRGETNDSVDTLFADVDGALLRIFQGTDVFGSHERYLGLRKRLLGTLSAYRIAGAKDASQSTSVEFVRQSQLDDLAEGIFRVPAVPRNTSNVKSITMTQYGIQAVFHTHSRVDAPKHTGDEDTQAIPLRVAVEMSGHMRTYQRCSESLVENVLRPNDALLFVATYPDLGDKRFGVRHQERDAAAEVEDIVSRYKGFLHTLSIVDQPTLTVDLRRWFPNLFQNTQWSWMIYQLYMLEHVHNVSVETKIPFDIFIRVRPDLFILGKVVLTPTTESSSDFTLFCGEHNWTATLTADQHLLRSPHHPRLQWERDPVSDHSAIGYAHTMDRFLRLFAHAKGIDPSQQQQVVFPSGMTAERLWTDHSKRLGVKEEPIFGWHIMIRNANKFTNNSVISAASDRRRVLIAKIFGVTDPTTVGCPNADGSMFRLPKLPKVRVKRKGKRH